MALLRSLLDQCDIVALEENLANVSFKVSLNGLLLFREMKVDDN